VSYTLKNVLSIPVMTGAKVLTAKEKIDTSHVQSVSVIEMPVEDFVRKNEFVLTTAIGCGENPAFFRTFVHDVFHAGAAALAIAIGRHVKKIPNEIIEYAKSLHFPLIELPWEMRFSDITRSILESIYNWEQQTQTKADSTQRSLLNMYLCGKSIDDAANLLETEISGAVTIVNGDGYVKGRSTQANLSKEAINSLLKLPSKEMAIGKSILFKMTIETNQKLLGYILITKESSSLDEFMFQSLLLEQATMPLSLWLQHSESSEATLVKIKEDFIWSLAKEEFESSEAVLNKAHALSFNIRKPYVCLIGQIENSKQLFEQEHSEDPYEDWIKKWERTLQHEMSSAAASINRDILGTYRNGRFLIYLQVPLDHIRQIAYDFLDALEKRVHHKAIISWGIGENQAGIQTFSEGYKDARTALEIVRAQHGPGHRGTYADTELYNVLLSISLSTEAQKTLHSLLYSLVDYEQKRGLDLIDTLTAYIANFGNISQTSRALNLHRQSLLYRLKKIESLTGKSLTDPDDLLLLHLSIKLWSIRFAIQYHQNEKETVALLL
jgi:purine catabolism regulator